MKLSVFSAAREHPLALAVATAEARLTYQALAAEVARVAARLSAQGLLQPSPQPVAVVAEPGLSCLCVLHALWSYGIAAFVLPARLPASERANWADRAGARGLLIPQQISDSRDSAEPPPRPTAHDPAAPLAIVPTSGSSGQPKLVVLSRGAFIAAAEASAANLPLSPHDRWLLCLPLSHVGGLSIVTRCLLARSAVIAFEPGARGLLASLPELALRLEQEQITLASLVPTVLDALLALEPRWSPGPALRAVLLGGAATTPKLLARALARGVPVLTTYGLTEACSQVTTTPLGTAPKIASELVSAGRPLPGTELRIDERQRICVRGPTLCSGFLDGVAPIDADGWLSSDDLGTLDTDGDLFVLGRVSDRIVTGGENVDPLRVEAALVSAQGVKQAVVFGVPDALFGELVACAIVPEPDFDASTLHAWLRQRLSPQELPRRLAVLSTLPLLGNGKVDRARTRELAESALFTWP
jgi:O-succinylbenzoic acid--CoA ligase